jgi:hippurate hydrolase
MNGMAGIGRKLYQEMTDWRRRLHRFPEFGFDVHHTAALIAALLRDWGLDVHEGIGNTALADQQLAS